MKAIECQDLTYSYRVDLDAPPAFATRNPVTPATLTPTSSATPPTTSAGEPVTGDAHTGEATRSDPTIQPRPQLRDINLALAPGTLTLIVGASGCGKSTLLRALNGLVPKFFPGDFAGTVKVLGTDLAQVELHDVGRTSSMIFQNPRTQFFTNYVDTELAFALENYAVPPQQIRPRVHRAASEAGIGHLLHRRLATLSGGQLQRVACACALVTQVDVLLFDEPTSNLSPAAVEDFRQLIAQLKAAGKTLVVAEHRLHLFAGLADRVLRMENGGIVERFDGPDFFALSPAQRSRRGLRSLRPIEPQTGEGGAYGAAPAPPPAGSESVSRAVASQSQRPSRAAAENTQESPTRQRTPHADTGLRVRNLKFSYQPQVPVLDLDEVYFPAGRVSVIAGENGAGKTTLARLICGLEKLPPGAEITFAGRKRNARQRQSRCALVMQDVRRQLFSASVVEELTVGRNLRSLDEAATAEVLQSLDLAILRERHPLSLSGGQAQRLVVATTVVANKQVVIFDEPTSGVDLRHLQSIARIIRQLADAGSVVLVITHDGELITECADHVFTLPCLSTRTGTCPPTPNALAAQSHGV